MDEKSYENILLNKISYKSLIDSKPLRVRFDKIDRIVKIYDGSRYLVLFTAERYDENSDRISYLISV